MQKIAFAIIVTFLTLVIAFMLVDIYFSIAEGTEKRKEYRVNYIESFSRPDLMKKLDGTKIFTVRVGDMLVIHYFNPKISQQYPDIKIPVPNDDYADIREIITPKYRELEKLKPEQVISLETLKLQNPGYIDRISN